MPYEDTDWTTADDTARSTAQHFYTDTGGAHVADGSGAQATVSSTGLDLTDSGGTTTAYFHADGAQVGADDSANMNMSSSGITMTVPWLVYDYQTDQWIDNGVKQALSISYDDDEGAALVESPESALMLQSLKRLQIWSNSDMIIRADYGKPVILVADNVEISNNSNTQLWSGTTQQLADALNGGPKVYAGSVVKTASGTNCQLWNKATFESTFNTTNAQMCGVSITNGEAGSLSAVVSAEYWSSGSNPGWFAKWTSSISSGARRFNYIVVVPKDVQA